MTIVDRAKALRTQVESLAEALEDDKALKVVELFPNWKANTMYSIGDRVRYGGVLYRCLSTHLSQTDWIPSDAVSLWARVLIPDPEVIPDWEQPESTNPYMKGDKVKHLNRIWISDVDNNVWEPSVYGWSEVI